MNRVGFFERLAHLSADDLERVQTAYWFSKNVHRTQSRDTGERYFEHPRRAALILLDVGLHDAETLETALLHDALEDTFAPPKVYVQLFGPEVFKNILLLSKSVPSFDPLTGEMIGRAKKDAEVYWQGIATGNICVRRVKCADRIDNLRSCADWPPERKDKYRAETVSRILPFAKDTDPQLYALLLEHSAV